MPRQSPEQGLRRQTSCHHGGIDVRRESVHSLRDDGDPSDEHPGVAGFSERALERPESIEESG